MESCRRTLQGCREREKEEKIKANSVRKVEKAAYPFPLARSSFPLLGCKATQIYIRVTWREHLFPEKQLYGDENGVSQESRMMGCVFKLLRHKLTLCHT
ncbi:hypothetical protein QQF64_030403 [Cirrhinus molitorella]|uniref:Uncharacterized protein n=1 Tax=Cirrhinus molitorella TaxID=172907 RepID=A0ABR3N3H6_9TELE